MFRLVAMAADANATPHFGAFKEEVCGDSKHYARNKIFGFT